MPVRRQVALGAAILASIAVGLAVETAPVAESAAVVTTTTDPPSPTIPFLSQVTTTMPPPSTTTTAPPPTTTTEAPRVEAQSETRSVQAAPTGDRFDRLASCETGGTMDPRATSSSGTFLGAFQFDLQTWQSIGRQGDPRDYSYADQKAAAMDLQASRGWRPWPTCARKLGYL